MAEPNARIVTGPVIEPEQWSHLTNFTLQHYKLYNETKELFTLLENQVQYWDSFEQTHLKSYGDRYVSVNRQQTAYSSIRMDYKYFDIEVPTEPWSGIV